ncbi:MAG: molybdopterin-synthase adenylyltransferase MoeB [Sphingobacteriales bacterium]|nr:molybdopterin-synthase adenylyltransferase MoeB [Sphingobacteriales bacterium]
MNAPDSILSQDEQQRYARQIAIPAVGWQGQEKLKKASVLVIGCGGLGCPLLQYLTAAGIGTIGIADDDIVSLSNLQRQILFTQEDIGKQKVEVAKHRLAQLNPQVKIEIFTERLTSKNALRLFADYDIICDGTDNFPTRYLVNDACVLSNKINVFAAVNRFDGQVSVFNHQSKINYRDLFPHPPNPDEVQNCAEAGVLGTMCGIVASIQANEVIKLILGIGDTLDGKLLRIDGLSLNQSVFTISKNSNIIIDTLIDYEHFCNMQRQPAVKEITADELRKMIENKQDFQLIDVRELHEHELQHIGGELMPMQSILSNQHMISKEKKVVMFCKSGLRSANVIRYLEKEGYSNLYNLQGGIDQFLK